MRTIAEDGLPPTVGVDLHADGLRDYFKARVAQHTRDTYAGLTMAKFPEDLRVYEHLLWCSRPSAVIELGVDRGGSTLWFRDRLAALSRYGATGPVQVIGVDVRLPAGLERDPAWHDSITLLEGDVCDPGLPERVAAELHPNARCLVVEDTAHTYETTMAALDGFHRFVAPGGFFVVEDGCVDDDVLRLESDWPRGVRPAVEAWLERQNGRFRVRRDLELYGVSCHPGGFLQRVPTFT